VKFGRVNTHIKLLSICESCENWCGDCHTLHKGMNTILSIFQYFSYASQKKKIGQGDVHKNLFII